MRRVVEVVPKVSGQTGDEKEGDMAGISVARVSHRKGSYESV